MDRRFGAKEKRGGKKKKDSKVTVNRLREKKVKGGPSLEKNIKKKKPTPKTTPTEGGKTGGEKRRIWGDESQKWQEIEGG